MRRSDEVRDRVVCLELSNHRNSNVWQLPAPRAGCLHAHLHCQHGDYWNLFGPLAGVNYRVKYLGSVEVDYDPTSTENNQESAQKAMRALYAHTKGSGIQSPTMALQVCKLLPSITITNPRVCCRQNKFGIHFVANFPHVLDCCLY